MTLSVLTSRRLYWSVVAALLIILPFELLLSVRQLSQSFDEGAHLYGGYRYWQNRDFGINPEHPPLVKLVAAAPLLPLKLKQPKPPPIYFRGEEFIGGAQLLYGNDADALLARARFAVSIFMFLLAVLVFTATHEMFGRETALIALILCVFEPTLLASGAMIATDMAVTFFLFASVYAFYRYVKQPKSATRLLLCCLAAGLALASKHSGLIVLPILALCAGGDLLISRPERSRRAIQLSGAVLAVAASAYVILWASYGFQYGARPNGLPMIPPLEGMTASLKQPATAAVILTLAHWHTFPMAYLYGWTDVLQIAREGRPVFILGRVLPTGSWYYFPMAFLIKTSLSFLVLLLLVPFSKKLRAGLLRREFLFLAIPPIVYLALSMTSHQNQGIRHLLPAYPFLIVLAAAAGWDFMSRLRWAKYAIPALLVFSVISSARVFPNYLTYANELVGGPSHTYRFINDSNVDWGQCLKQVSAYLRSRNIHDCWFAYNDSMVDPAYYKIPCKPLPSAFAMMMGSPQPTIQPTITGTVLMSTMESSGTFWGPAELNPYRYFQDNRPDALVANAISVFHGTFDLPLAAAYSHANAAFLLMQQGKAAEGFREAQVAVAMAPNAVFCQAALGATLLRMHKAPEGRAVINKALSLARSVHPEYQARFIPILESMLAGPHS